MQQIPENILVLIEKYLAGKASFEEKERLNEWYRSFNDSEAELLVDEDETELRLQDRVYKRTLETIQKNRDREEVRIPRRKWQLPAIAASIVVLFSVGVYWILGSSQKQIIAKTQIAKQVQVNDIGPGGNKAMLTLMDGSNLVLDTTSNGIITQQGNVGVQKLDNGQLAYTINSKEVKENDKGFYNTITTPRGGQYHITLSDGTKVWLNAASSIRFPVMFTGSERNVEITGEAYFEVTKNPGMPFKVKTGGSEIEVLGTHFNVNAYDDESTVKTTLLEGSVKVFNTLSGVKSSPVYLVPGQQAGITKSGKINVISNADLEEAMAWKNGRFQFRSADLNSILRQISRWYDVDIVYNGKVDLHFTGQLTRNENVSKVFEKLKLTGEVNFKIDGNKIIVSR